MAFGFLTGGDEGLSRVRSIGYVCVLVGALVLIYLFGFQGMRFFMVPSSSMEPTLLPNDHLLTLSHGRYERGDIVVLADPDDPLGYIVKRIIGLAGDRIAIRNGTVIVNGEELVEPYVREQMRSRYQLNPAQTVPDSKVFLLGDNRNRSEDSASYDAWNHSQAKFYDIGSVVGKVHLIYLPASRFGRI